MDECFCVLRWRGRKRQTHTQADRQTDGVSRQTVQTDRQTDGQTDRQIAVLEQVWPSYVSYGCLK